MSTVEETAMATFVSQKYFLNCNTYLIIKRLVGFVDVMIDIFYFIIFLAWW